MRPCRLGRSLSRRARRPRRRRRLRRTSRRRAPRARPPAAAIEQVAIEDGESAYLPTSRVPVTSSRWFTYAEPEVNPARASIRSRRSSGRKTSRSPEYQAGARRSTAISISHSGFGARDAPVRAHREDRAGGPERPERVLPAPPFADERDRQHVHLVLVGRPERLRVRDDAELAEPPDVIGMDDLDVRDVRARVRRAVRASRRLDGIERRAHRAVADRVEVRLEPEGVERRDPGLEALGIDLEQTAVVGRPAVAVEVRLEHRAGEVLEDAVHHELDARRRVPADGRGPPTLHELLDLLGAAVVLPPHRPDHAPGQLAAGGQRDVGPLLACRARRWRPARR